MNIRLKTTLAFFTQKEKTGHCVESDFKKL